MIFKNFFSKKSFQKFDGFLLRDKVLFQKRFVTAAKSHISINLRPIGQGYQNFAPGAFESEFFSSPYLKLNIVKSMLQIKKNWLTREYQPINT